MKEIPFKDCHRGTKRTVRLWVEKHFGDKHKDHVFLDLSIEHGSYLLRCECGEQLSFDHKGPTFVF